MDGGKEYQRNCRKLAETLLKDEMAAIMVQLKIDRATRSTVTDGRGFIDVLEKRKLISVGDFNRLVPLLKEIDQDQLALLLENYMTDYEAAAKSQPKSGSTSPDKIKVEAENTNFPRKEKGVPSIKTSGICKEHETPQEVTCLGCYVHVCFACAYLYHKDHQILPMEEVEANVQVETKAVLSKIETIKKEVKNLESLINFLEEKCLSMSDEELKYMFQKNCEVITILQQKFQDYISYKVAFFEAYLERARKIITGAEQEIFLTEEEIGVKLYPDSFTQLYELNKRDRNMKDIENNIAKISQQLNYGSMDISVRPTSISASVAKVAHGYILGTVMASAEQMIVVRSQDISNKCLNLACICCFDPKNLIWEYTFECERKPHPLVLGNKLHIAPRSIELLTGCGNELTVFQLNRKENCFHFEKKTNITLDIPKDSHITAISTITGARADTGIIVSDKISGILQIFDNKFKLAKKLKPSGDVEMVSCVFRENVYKCAVAAFKSQKVDIMKANPDEELLREFCRLEVKFSNLSPQSLLFDGAFFTVLWVSRENIYSEGQKWKVVAYDDDGKECNVCKEGSCDPNITAVSISHVKNDTLLCFSNGTFDIFKTVRL